jgi:hypothetical protein
MADTFTTNLNLTKPEVGASTDTWGTKINADLDAVDAIFSGTGTSVAINLDGAVIDSSVIGGTTAAAGSFTTLTASTSITGTLATAAQPTASTSITGTLATAAQPNITSVGTLTGFTSTGIDDNADATAITIDSSERVGIGTTSPDELLEIEGTEAAGSIELLLTNVGDGGSSTTPYTAIRSRLNSVRNGGEIRFGRDSNYGSAANADSNMQFYTALNDTNTERMRINSSGNVGIGTTNPQARLHVDNGAGTRMFLGLANNIYHDAYDHIFRTPSGASTTMTIQNTGNVGIGTTSPNALLTVGSTSTSGPELQIMSSTSGTGYLYFGDGTSGTARYDGFIGYNQHTSYMVFATGGGAEAMRINDAALVCIGDTTERSGNQDTIKALQVTGGEAVMGIKNETVTDPSQRGMIIFTINDNSAQGRITCNNSSTLFTSLSDYRLKEVLEPLPNGLDRLNQLNPVKFKWKKQGYNAEGFLAHEVAEIYPEAVSGEKDGEDMQSMDYGRITPLLVKAIQEQQEQIEQLKTEIQTLKGE